MPRISFSFDPAKFIQAAAYLTRRCPPMTRMKLVKLIYFADKRHLLEWGRPITGDRYIAMERGGENGPVPSGGYDLIKTPDERFARHFRVSSQSIALTSDPGTGDLSPSDIEALDAVAQNLGRRSATFLRDLSHKDPAWQRAAANGPMSFQDFFDTPESASTLSLVHHEQEMRDFIKRINHPPHAPRPSREP